MGSAEIMKLSAIDLEKVHISFVKVEFLLLYEQDISLGVAIGSSTQISMFVVSCDANYFPHCCFRLMYRGGGS
jgi:hypothetical protein